MNTVPLPMQLTQAQMAQQIDLSLRMLHLASLGTPRIESTDPNAPQLLTLHALITAYLALASATPGIAATASALAFDISHELTLIAEQHAATAH
jgi:hypothetical protein